MCICLQRSLCCLLKVYVSKKFLVSAFPCSRVDRDRRQHQKRRKEGLNGVRRPPLRPHPVGPPLHGVRRGILWARRGDGGAGRGPPPPVPARGLLSSPHRPPRHHRIVLERRGLPVSRKCPGPSRNQPVNRGSPLPAGGECGKPAGREYGKPNDP